MDLGNVHLPKGSVGGWIRRVRWPELITKFYASPSKSFSHEKGMRVRKWESKTWDLRDYE